MNRESGCGDGQTVDRRKVSDLDLSPDDCREADDCSCYEQEREPGVSRRFERPWRIRHLSSQYEHRCDGKDKCGPFDDHEVCRERIEIAECENHNDRCRSLYRERRPWCSPSLMRFR